MKFLKLIIICGVLIFPTHIYSQMGYEVVIDSLDVGVGDIVVRDYTTGIFKISESEDAFNVFGVVSKKPQFFLRTDNLNEGTSVVRIGQLLVNVSLLGGDISKGDRLTTSAIPGFAMKANKSHKYIFGIADDDFNQENAQRQIYHSGSPNPVYVGQIAVQLKIGSTQKTEVTGGGEESDVRDQISRSSVSVGDFVSVNLQSIRDLTEETASGVASNLRDTGSQIIAQVLSTGGLFVGFASLFSLLFASSVFLDFIFAPLRIWALIQSRVSFRSRGKPWGTVYDAITKQPLDPVYVTLEDENKRVKKTVITDLDGRYGFLAEPGRYKIKVEKANYSFPSKIMEKKRSDSLYADIYFGDFFEIKSENEVISKNIPMDSERFDWNEFAKQRLGVMNFYSYANEIKVVLSRGFFYLGFIASLILVMVLPVWYNYLIFLLYLIVLILRFVFKKRKYGSITYLTNNKPLSYAILNVYSLKHSQEILKTSCDKFGRFFVLIPNGDYYVTVDEKIGENNYKKVFTSDGVKVRNGILNNKFKV